MGQDFLVKFALKYAFWRILSGKRTRINNLTKLYCKLKCIMPTHTYREQQATLQ